VQALVIASTELTKILADQACEVLWTVVAGSFIPFSAAALMFMATGWTWFWYILPQTHPPSASTP
jgi:hypothetical protein